MGDSTTAYAGGARQTMGWFVLVSAALHLLGVGVVASVPWFDGSDVSDVEADEERKEMSVKLAQPREPEAALAESPTPEREEQERKQAVPEAEEEREKPEPTERQNRKTVDQQNNEENPEKADYLASEANQTDEQTRARETTTSRAQPAKEQSPNEREETTPEGGENPAAMASRASPSERSGPEESSREPSEPSEAPEPPERARESDTSDEAVEEAESEREVDESGDVPTPDGESSESHSPSEETSEEQASEEMPKGPPMPTMGEYERMFGGEDAEREERADRETGGQGGPGSDVFKNIEERQGRVKAALENYLTHIKPGNHTSVNAKRSVYASYINRIHRKIHANWGNEYLPRLDNRYGPGHPLSNADLRATLEIVVDGGSGEVEDVNIVESSGVTSYDAEAVMIAYDTGPHPEAPDEVVSPDGNVYLHWNFWRNQRQCGTFGVSVYKRTDTEGGGAEKREIAPTGDEE